jgi:hypothetical protein
LSSVSATLFNSLIYSINYGLVCSSTSFSLEK